MTTIIPYSARVASLVARIRSPDPMIREEAEDAMRDYLIDHDVYAELLATRPDIREWADKRSDELLEESARSTRKPQRMNYSGD